MEHTLFPHSTTPFPLGLRIGVTVAREPSGGLTLCYRFAGATDALVWPEAQAPVRADGLWQATCCEAFVLAGGGPAYLELNAAPSGAWAAYAFETERGRRRDAAIAPISVAASRGDGGLSLHFNAAGVDVPSGGDLRVGLSVVVLLADGRLAYWALNHPKDRPDFHDPRGFSVRLP